MLIERYLAANDYQGDAIWRVTELWALNAAATAALHLDASATSNSAPVRR